MRKIEELMLRAIVKKVDWSLSNTQVIIRHMKRTPDAISNEPVAHIYLYNTLIAVYDYNSLMHSSTNPRLKLNPWIVDKWSTATTKSRVNALLALPEEWEYYFGFKCCTRNFEVYFQIPGEKKPKPISEVCDSTYFSYTQYLIR